jgi:hypothetical protein
MKIGLVTYHYSANNGAMLQAYATIRALQSLGHEVVIVDIRQHENKHNGVKGAIAHVFNVRRDNNARAFRERFYPSLTKRYYSLDELKDCPPVVDCLMVGSDQTWNLDISKELAMAYFLDFGPDSLKRISYASSFGVGEWTADNSVTAEIRRALNKFNSISVREKTGADLLERVFGLKAAVALDPSLLHDSYSELTGPVPQTNEVVCYKLERNAGFFKDARAFNKYTGLPVRMLNNAYPVPGLRYTYPPSVSEWLKRIAGARLVITDSFHGVALSILYKRNFVALPNNNGKDSRLLDLLDALGLLGRVFKTIPLDDSVLLPMDYDSVYEKLDVLRRKSWEFLQDAVNQ